MTDSIRHRLATDGFCMLHGVFTAEQAAAMRRQLEDALGADVNGSTLRAADASVYGARNVLRLWPPVAHIGQRPPLSEILRDVLGPNHGLVRVLYFDKPPEQSWALPWHKDLTIAVTDNRLASERFRKPTTKAGMPHIEAPVEVLQTMLTLRLHLDDVTEENGPLKVMRGSHASGKEAANGDYAVVSVLAEAGDVLLMRPLVCHCSNRSHPGTTRHRRIVHLEFAASAELPDGFAWHDFITQGPPSVGLPG